MYCCICALKNYVVVYLKRCIGTSLLFNGAMYDFNVVFAYLENVAIVWLPVT